MRGNGDGKRDGDGDGNEDEYGDKHEVGDEVENGSRNGDENRDEDGREREPEYLRRGSTKGGSEDAKKRATPTRNQQPQPQDTTPQRDRHTMWRTTAQESEARERIGEGGEEANGSKKPQKSYRRNVENGGDLGGRRKNGDKCF